VKNIQRERERRPQVCPRYEDVANFYCGVCKRWGRVTQKVTHSRILPAKPCHILKNLDIHGTNGYLRKAQESQNRNIVYRLGQQNARGSVTLKGRKREKWRA